MKLIFILVVSMVANTAFAIDHNEAIKKHSISLGVGQTNIKINQNESLSGWSFGASGKVMFSDEIFITASHTRLGLNNLPIAKGTNIGFGYIGNITNNVYFESGLGFNLVQFNDFNLHSNSIYGGFSYISSKQLMFTTGLQFVNNGDISSSIEKGIYLDASLMLYDNFSFSTQLNISSDGLTIMFPLTWYIEIN